MKRLLVLLIILLFLGASGTAHLTAQLTEQDDKVTITETALYGDPTIVRDATLTLSAELDQHLHWDITYPVSGEAVTEYDFSLTERKVSSRHSYAGITLNSHLVHGYSLSFPAEQQTGLARAYRELYDQTAPGTEGRMIVRLQDYYEYYPLRLSVDLPGTLWNARDYEDIAADEDYINELAVWDAFIDFFKIPIPEEISPIEIHITKSANSQGIGWGSSALNKDDISYDLFSESAYTSDRCFFSINNRIAGAKGMLVDTSLIPGGYGIYSFTYRHVRNASNTGPNYTTFHPGYDTGVDADSLKMVYPLDPAVQVLSMHVDPTETKLLLLTTRAGREAVDLTVIDIATMTALQQIKLTDSSLYVGVDQRDDFVLFSYDLHFQLFSVNDEGHYVHELTAALPHATDEAYAYLDSYHRSLDWDGKRLIIADVLPVEQYQSFYTTDFALAVYDPSGLLYYGEYRNSLSVNPNTALYAYNPLPTALAVTW